MLTRTLCLVSLIALLSGGAALAQDSDAAAGVRALYASAAYDDALREIEKAPPTARLEAYRAFCLLALGNVPDAQAAVKRAVLADPWLVPSEAEASPRVRAFFDGVRTELLPGLVREMYTRAKAAYVAKDLASARADFERTLGLIASLAPAARAPLADLELLAREFRDLSSAPAPAEPASPKPQVSEVRAPAPAVVITRPVPVRQVFPIWRWGTPPEQTVRGVVRVHIDAAGVVLRAEIVTPTDARYDQEVLTAARLWRYQPATRDGRPLPSELEVTYLLKGK